ncbi:MAG: hypothetical protein ACI82Z_001818 [Cellvibrionaceae bacterium]|jgi:hypothetical protein
MIKILHIGIIPTAALNRRGFVRGSFIWVMQLCLTRFVDSTAFHIQRLAHRRWVEATGGY